MEPDLKGLEGRIKTVEAEVIGLREITPKNFDEEIDLDDLASSIAVIQGTTSRTLDRRSSGPLRILFSRIRQCAKHNSPSL